MQVLFYISGFLCLGVMGLLGWNELQDFKYNWISTQPLTDIAEIRILLWAILSFVVGIVYKISK